ncbi:unnamed protein product, partial [Meganyctiphanes norvegica]
DASTLRRREPNTGCSSAGGQTCGTSVSDRSHTHVNQDQKMPSTIEMTVTATGLQPCSHNCRRIRLYLKGHREEDQGHPLLRPKLTEGITAGSINQATANVQMHRRQSSPPVID